MTPPQLHMHFDVLFNAGKFPTKVVGEPGTHGVVTGTHGMGVSTPSAADVAAATVGLAMDMHTPNGGMLAMGLKSMIVAGGMLHTRLVPGVAISELGAAPKLHCSIAPIVTACPIVSLP